VWCDCCGCWFTKADILRVREAIEAMEEAEAIAYAEAHARKHMGQDYGCEPVLPYHANCTDILHLYLNVVKSAVSHVFHKPFQMDKRSYEGEVKVLMIGLRDKLNARMDADFTDKHFGGEGAFALHGDQVKIFMRGG